MEISLLLIGLVLLGVSMGFASASLLLLRRVGRAGSVMEGLTQVVFLPEKRRRFLWIMSLEGSLFLLSGLSLGVFLVLGLPITLGLALFAAFFVGGVSMVSWLTFLGLRPSQLTQEEKEAVRRELPNLIPGLAFLPIHDQGEDLEDSRQLYVVSLPARRRPSGSESSAGDP